MHFRLLIILLLVNLFHAQSLYKSSVGIGYDSYSAKSISLGSTSSTTDRSAFCISINPSNMSLDTKGGLSIISSYQGKYNTERRSLVVKDFFGDYLAEADYVKNSSIFNSLMIGIKYNLKTKFINLSTGLSAVPFNIFNYNYEEEVRGQLESEDGSIFSRDPLLGYHVLDSKGTQNLYSIGSSLKIKLMKNVVTSIGYGYNILNEATISEKVYVDTLVSEDNIELALIDPYDVDYSLRDTFFPSYGFNLRLKRTLLNFSFQDGVVIERSISDDDYSDLISYYSNLTSLYGDNWLATYYFSNYFALKIYNEIHKPKKYNISLAILDKDKLGFNFVINYEKNEYDKDYPLSTYERYSIAIEHFGFNELPLRFGIQYSQSPFKPYITSITSFSIGSGFQPHKNLILDYAVNFKHTSYHFPDLFPVENEYRPDLDIVNDTETNFIITMNYNF